MPVETEPNNNFRTATILFPDKAIDGFFNTINDHDFYRVEISQNSVLSIYLSGVKGINHALRLWRGGAQPIVLKLIDDNRKSSPEEFPNLSVKQGVYYIEVLHGARDRKKASLDTPYNLKITLREALKEENEPNDNKDSADMLSMGDEVTGFFAPAYNRLNTGVRAPEREEDWFSFHHSGGIVDINLSGVPGVNSVLYLYNSEMKEIASSNSQGSGEGESITDMGLTDSANYYIVVAKESYSSNSKEPYTLIINEKPHDPGYEVEKNDDYERANQIKNNVISGKLHFNDDKDFFLFSSSGEPDNSSSVYRIELRPPENMDAALSIFDSEKKKIMDINDRGAGKVEVFPDLAISGNFYCAVSGRIEGLSHGGDYVLSITPVQVEGQIEIEPNDTKGSATRFDKGPFYGYISHSRDIDYYLLNFDSRRKISIHLRGVKGGELKISVTDPPGYILQSKNVRGAKDISLTETIDKKGYIIIESLSENYDYPYQLRIRGVR